MSTYSPALGGACLLSGGLHLKNYTCTIAPTGFLLKRSLASGFSGAENPLFFKENTQLLFGDAKASLSQLVAEFEALRDAA